MIADAPSFDTDQLPGVDTNFGSGISSDIGSLNVASIGQLIWNNEDGPGTKNIFIGQSGSVYDTAPTPKSVNSFGNIRGLAPEEPTRQGGITLLAWPTSVKPRGFGKSIPVPPTMM